MREKRLRDKFEMVMLGSRSLDVEILYTVLSSS